MGAKVTLSPLQSKFFQCLEITGDISQALSLTDTTAHTIQLWRSEIKAWDDLVEAALACRLPAELIVQTTGQRMARSTSLALDRVLNILLDEQSPPADVLRAAKEIFSTSGLDDQAVAVNPTENFRTLALFLAASGHLRHIPPDLVNVEPGMEAKVAYLREVMSDVHEEVIPTIEELMLHKQPPTSLPEGTPGVQWAHVTWKQLSDMLPTSRLRSLQRLCVLVLWSSYRTADEFGWFKLSMLTCGRASGNSDSTHRANMGHLEHIGLVDAYQKGRSKTYRVVEPELVELLITDEEAAKEVRFERISLEILRDRLETQVVGGAVVSLPTLAAVEKYVGT